MTTWGTTSYTPVPDPDVPSVIAWAETHRDLTPEELPRAVFAVEVSTDHGRTYASNGLRWLDPEDARRWGNGLLIRWYAPTNIRVVRITPPPSDVSTGFPGYDVAEVIFTVL